MKNILFFLILLFLKPLSYAQWLIQEIKDVPYCNSTFVDSNNQLYIVGDKEYVKLSGKSWIKQKIISQSHIGIRNALIDKDDNIHLIYGSNIEGNNQKLQYIKGKNGKFSSPVTIYTFNSGVHLSSMLIDEAGMIHISFYTEICDMCEGPDNSGLKYVKGKDNSWKVESVEEGAEIGLFSSIVVDGKGTPHIAYYENTNKTLKYAKKVGKSWLIQTIERIGKTTTHIPALSISIGIDKKNCPFIVYYNEIEKSLKYAISNGVSWSIKTLDAYKEVNEVSSAIKLLDTEGDVGMDLAMIVDSSYTIHISYIASLSSTFKKTYELRYLTFKDGSINIQKVYSSNEKITNTSINIDKREIPYIIYRIGKVLNYATLK